MSFGRTGRRRCRTPVLAEVADRTVSLVARRGLSTADDAVTRLAFIGAAKHLRLLLEEISELLSVREANAGKEVKSDLRPRVVLAWPKQRARTAGPPIFGSPTPI